MNRVQLLAAEIFGYSFANYADHLGIGHVRYERLMPADAKTLETAEREGWPASKIAVALEVDGHVADLHFTPVCAMLLTAAEGERHGTHFCTLSSLSQRSSHQRRQDHSWATTL